MLPTAIDLFYGSPWASAVKFTPGNSAVVLLVECNPRVVLATSIVASEKENSSSKKTYEVDDLISLTHLHEPAILHAFEMRFAHDIIYTSTGPIFDKRRALWLWYWLTR